jgi:hypothetical protein
VRDRLEELGTDTEVVLATFTGGDEVLAYAADHDLGFPVLRDPDRAAYRAFGLGRGSVRRVWGRRALRRYVELIRRDGLGGLHRPTEDTLQLGGDFVVAPDGTLAWGFWGEGPDDRPSIDALVAAVELARSGPPDVA